MLQFYPFGLFEKSKQPKSQAEIRYQETVRMIAAQGHGWCLLDESEETATLDFDGYVHVCIWPSKEAAEAFADDGENPFQIPMEDLLETAEELAEDPSCRFAVYPTQEDLWIVSPDTLLEDLTPKSEAEEKAIRKQEENEVQQLWKQPPKKRYAYTIHKTADWGQVWMLHQDGGESAGETETGPCLRIWPRELAAKQYLAAHPALAGTVFSMDTEDFAACLESGEEIRQLSVFPTESDDGIVEKETFLEDLCEELEQYM